MTQKQQTRRSFLRGTAAAALAFPMLNMGSYKVFAASDRKYSARVIEVVKRTQVFDMLANLSPFGQMMMVPYREKPAQQDGFKISPAHLQLLLESGVDVFHPAVGVGAEEAQLFIARLNAYSAEYPNHLRRIDSLSDLDGLRKNQRVGYIIGMQNSEHFQSLDDVNMFYHLGQRISQLTYNSKNKIGVGSTAAIDNGLTEYGGEVVARMNELGMAVDVSHCGDRTTLDAFAASTKPVLITHSNVRKLAGGHVRAKPDEAIKAMAKSESVMGITGVRQFVRGKEPTNIEHLIDHIDYIAKLVGVEHVGMGSDLDMDGYDDIPEPAYSGIKSGYNKSYAFRDKIDTDGFDHPKRIFDLTDGLIRRGYSEGDIGRILGGNFKRVLGKIWTV